MSFSPYYPTLHWLPASDSRWVDRALGAAYAPDPSSPATDHPVSCASTTYAAAAGALCSLPYYLTASGFRAKLIGSFALVLAQPADVMTAPLMGSEWQSAGGPIRDGQVCPEISTVSGYFAVTGTVTLGPYGRYWTTDGWPSCDFIEAEYQVDLSGTTEEGVAPLVGESIYVRFVLTGGAATFIDPSSPLCQKPYWWDDLYAISPSDASSMFLSLVHFWQVINGMDATASFLEDTVGADSSWSRVTLVLPHPTADGSGIVLYRIPQYVSPTASISLTIDAAAATYPCAPDCIEGFPDFSTQLARVADALVSGDNSVASLLLDIKKTVQAAATVETNIKTSFDGLFLSSSTGASEGE